MRGTKPKQEIPVEAQEAQAVTAIPEDPRVEPIRQRMVDFFTEHKSMSLHREEIAPNIWLSNCKPSQTDEDGKRKFETGRETISLIKTRASSDLVLAKLRETDNGSLEFEVIHLMEYIDSIPIAA